jgi:hypothetical protein
MFLIQGSSNKQDDVCLSQGNVICGDFPSWIELLRLRSQGLDEASLNCSKVLAGIGR